MQGTRALRMRKIIRLIIIPVIVFAALIAIDQITKLCFKNLNETRDLRTNPVSVINGFFYIEYTENAGSAYGFLSGKAWAQTFFKVLTCVALVLFALLYVYAYKKSQTLMAYSLVFITGGTVGNFIDRLARGRVIDFMSAEFFGKRLFGIFNLSRYGILARINLIYRRGCL